MLRLLFRNKLSSRWCTAYRKRTAYAEVSADCLTELRTVMVEIRWPSHPGWLAYAYCCPAAVTTFQLRQQPAARVVAPALICWATESARNILPSQNEVTTWEPKIKTQHLKFSTKRMQICNMVKSWRVTGIVYLFIYFYLFNTPCVYM